MCLGGCYDHQGVTPSVPPARIFREDGVAQREPRKKPRSAWQRFVYPAPNACWQLDGTEYVLTAEQPDAHSKGTAMTQPVSC